MIRHSFMLLLICLSLASFSTFAAGLVSTIATIKPSIVGIGGYNKSASPRASVFGTGFAIGDGSLVATNAHVVDSLIQKKPKDKLSVFVGTGRNASVRSARVVAKDVSHDLAILSFDGAKLTPVNLHQGSMYSEGYEVAFTGYPIGAVLGLYPVTHRGIISAITPIVTPARSARELTTAQIKRAKNPYMVYQLDATAYPGNSGSPLYKQSDGTVIAVINKVFVKSSKETILSDPSAITYAIPSQHLVKMLAGIK